jgi:hypothetical protein
VQIFYRLGGIPRNDKWNIFLELKMDKLATMIATPDDIVTKLIEKEAAFMTENGFAPEALPCAMKGGKGGNGSKAAKGSSSPKKDKRDNKNDRKEKDFRKCFYSQRQWHTTGNYLSKQRGNPPKAADTAAKSSTDTTLTLTTSIENYWMVAGSSALSSNWFINCGCTNNISGH